MTVIFPSKVSLRKIPVFSKFSNFVNFSSVFCLKACSSLVKKYTPRAFTEEFDHFNFFLSGQRISVAFLVL